MRIDIEHELRELCRTSDATELTDAELDALVSGGIGRGRAQLRRGRRRGLAVAAGVVLLAGSVALGVVRWQQAYPQPAAPVDEMRDLGRQAVAALQGAAPSGVTVTPVAGGNTDYAMLTQRFTWQAPEGTSSGELRIWSTGRSGASCPEAQPGIECRTGEHGPIQVQRIDDDRRGGKRMTTVAPLPLGHSVVITQWTREGGAASRVSTASLPWSSKEVFAAMDSQELDAGLQPVLDQLDQLRQEHADDDQASPAPTTPPIANEEISRSAVSEALAPDQLSEMRAIDFGAGQSFLLDEGRVQGMLGVAVSRVAEEGCAAVTWSAVACREVTTTDGRGHAADIEDGWPALEVRREVVFRRDEPVRRTPWDTFGVSTVMNLAPTSGTSSARMSRSLDQDLAVVQSTALEPLVTRVGEALD